MDKKRKTQFVFMYSKVWLLFFLFFFLAFAGRTWIFAQELVNCLVAVVDGSPISLFDLKVIESFKLLPESGSEIYQDKEEVLNNYINQLLVVELTREQIKVSQEELEKELEQLKEQLGKSIFEEKCQLLGMKETDLVPYLESKLLFEKIIGSRFSQKFYISLQEIEDYYQKVYVPEETAKGRKPAEMVNVLDQIEARLQNQKLTQQIREWTDELRQRAEIFINFNCLKKAQEEEVK